MLVYKEMPLTINRKVVLTPLERSWFSRKSDIRSFLLRSHSEEVADIRYSEDDYTSTGRNADSLYLMPKKHH